MYSGSIYKIVSPHTDRIYIGSTRSHLRKRMYEHKNRQSVISSKQILDAGDARIELIERWEGDNINDLRVREGVLVRENMDLCVNKRIENRTSAEYYQDHKEKICKKKRSTYVRIRDRERDADAPPYAQLQRYYDNKEDIKRSRVLGYIKMYKRRPTQKSVDKYQITEDEIQKMLS